MKVEELSFPTVLKFTKANSKILPVSQFFQFEVLLQPNLALELFHASKTRNPGLLLLTVLLGWYKSTKHYDWYQ